MRTTHPDSPHRQADAQAWRQDLAAFCSATRFVGLTILDAPEPRGDRGAVTFHAVLDQGGRDVSFTERSTFSRVDGRWVYVDGAPETGPAP